MRRAGAAICRGEWLREAGIDGADLSDPQHRKAVFEVTRKLLREADEYYRSALFGMQRLPLGAAVGIGCARRVYRDIGRIVANRGETHGMAAPSWGEAGRRRRRYRARLLRSAHTTLRIGYAPRRKGLWTVPELGKAVPKNRPFAYLVTRAPDNA